MRIPLSAALLCLLNLPASAGMENCLIEVEGKQYLSGPCNVDREPDGSLSVGTGNQLTGSPFFAYLDKQEDGSMRGTWNGSPTSKHAQNELGTMERRGACWINAKAMVCARR